MALALVCIPAALGAQADSEALSILEKASVRYERLTGLCADFRQTLEVPLLRQTTSAAGEVCQLDPNFFQMRFTDPEGDRIVADGTWLWMYLPSAQPGQVIRMQMAEGSQSIDFHREFLEDPGVKYAPTLVGAETVGGVATRHLRLQPLQANTGYSLVDVWLDAAASWIRRIRIEQENGSVRTLDLDRIRLDPALSPADFAFDPPPGATVVIR